MEGLDGEWQEGGCVFLKRSVARLAATALLSGLMALATASANGAGGDPPSQGFSSDGTSGDAKAWAIKKRQSHGRAHKQGSTTPKKSNSSPASTYETHVVDRANLAGWPSFLVVTQRAKDCATCTPLLTVAPAIREQSRTPSGAATDPEQAAYIAIARLHLNPPKPVIGPSPQINEWNMAAVGYPYWLWADGNLNPAPVSTTVADLTVRLDAHLQSTTFDLGDGTRLTCTDLTKKWNPAVEPGAASPACGHTYTRPSLPQGELHHHRLQHLGGRLVSQRSRRNHPALPASLHHAPRRRAPGPYALTPSTEPDNGEESAPLRCRILPVVALAAPSAQVGDRQCRHRHTPPRSCPQILALTSADRPWTRYRVVLTGGLRGMASRLAVRGFVAGSCLLAFVSSACTPSDPPTTPSPSTSATVPTETAQEREEREAYAAAETSYRAARSEYNRVTSLGGASTSRPSKCATLWLAPT